MRPKSYRAKKRDGRTVEVSLVNPDTRLWEVVVAEPMSSELAAELERMGATPTQVLSAKRRHYEIADWQLEDAVRVALGGGAPAAKLLARIRRDHGPAARRD
jgi:hypothetical protein